jgi:hypothetical protein
MRGQSGLVPLRGNDFPNRYSATLGAKIIMSFSGQSDSDSQNSACDLANYVLVERASLALFSNAWSKNYYVIFRTV